MGGSHKFYGYTLFNVRISIVLSFNIVNQIFLDMI